MKRSGAPPRLSSVRPRRKCRKRGRELDVSRQHGRPGDPRLLVIPLPDPLAHTRAGVRSDPSDLSLTPRYY